MSLATSNLASIKAIFEEGKKITFEEIQPDVLESKNNLGLHVHLSFLILLYTLYNFLFAFRVFWDGFEYILEICNYLEGKLTCLHGFLELKGELSEDLHLNSELLRPLSSS